MAHYQILRRRGNGRSPWSEARSILSCVSFPILRRSCILVLLLDASTIVDALQHTITWDFAQVPMPREVEATGIAFVDVSHTALVFRSARPTTLKKVSRH